jgi:hypothetical protein
MRLVDHLSLFRKWPPPAHNPGEKPAHLEHGLDTLVLAFTRTAAEHGDRPHPQFDRSSRSSVEREILDTEQIFAIVFWDFLNKHKGGRSVRAEN